RIRSVTWMSTRRRPPASRATRGRPFISAPWPARPSSTPIPRSTRSSDGGGILPVIASPFLVGRDRYERAIEGWVDNTHGDAFTPTVTIADDDGAVELAAVCTPSPGYEVRDVRARILSGAVDPRIPESLGQLPGARMVGGFTRRLAELCGAGNGAGLF